jgi:hypothetical protein
MNWIDYTIRNDICCIAALDDALADVFISPKEFSDKYSAYNLARTKGLHYIQRLVLSSPYCANCCSSLSGAIIYKPKHTQYVYNYIAEMPIKNEGQNIYAMLGIDHIIPIGIGGSQSKIQNHRILCTHCNSRLSTNQVSNRILNIKES